MSAARELSAVHRRASRVPAFLQPTPALDQVEVIEIASGEVVLFWDVPATEAKHFVRALRRDMKNLDAEVLVAAWSTVEAPT